MTVQSLDVKEVYVGNGAQTDWPFDFSASDPLEVEAWLGYQTTGVEVQLSRYADFTVALHANQITNPGGVATIPTAVPANVHVLIKRVTPTARVHDIQTSASPNMIEDELDALVRTLQEQREFLDRCLHVGAAQQTIPRLNAGNVANRADSLIGMDADGNLSLIPLVGGVATGARGPALACEVTLSAPAIFVQSAGGWSHSSCIATFTWRSDGVQVAQRVVTVELDTGAGEFLVPTPVAGVTITQDATKHLTHLSSEYDEVADYIQLAAVPRVELPADTDTFTPTWGTGEFGSAPTGEVDLSHKNGLVTLQAGTGSLVATGSSTLTLSWQAGTIPASMRPAADKVVPCMLRYGASSIVYGMATVGADGGVDFAMLVASAFTASAFASGESKGLPTDWTITYPL